MPVARDKEQEETDITEKIKFNRKPLFWSPLLNITDICPDCDHQISIHKYNFKVVKNRQKFNMECELCGSGEDSSVIDPDLEEKPIY
ncbi:hypothetical protein PROFUN_13540 [Planoprotostelium fungivorum]|uniref:Uncharacterized protein n=1 Tax=Planoprotostelium fungivorum TaxID=1890364 RepID=A0A2P6N3R8_9EUKA|nr:hypothetical protein PROFUN_13540 [Planoprotostelium fungivorum]